MRTTEATFTRICRFKSRATIINAPVTRIEICGVLNLTLIFARKSGNRPSWLKARGYLEAAIIPAFAVEMNAKIAAMLKAVLPNAPMKTPAPSEMGVSE